ncbi:hypothetical protein [Streptomyces sp. 5-10]|uniref:hypothetical protein n=1 Tax=Streptomyces sp. 5-10 TaxID=878925 RepID=UPI00168AC03B|nr:hypothetical protein [Streptomyces sp. 5-10]MBD3004745.1 hypothetical protein [Streptomyces sp. 5-10]
MREYMGQGKAGEAAKKAYGLPELPQPLHANPSSYWINDLARNYLEAGTQKIKEFGLGGLIGKGDAREAQDCLRSFNVDDGTKRQILTIAQDAYPFALWHKNRVVYDVHPQMTRSLMSMRSTTKIPASIFERLRHPNPFFVIPAATPVTHADGLPGRIIGFYVTGACSPRYEPTAKMQQMEIIGRAPLANESVLYDTHDATPNALHAMVLSEVHDANQTEVADLDWCHLTLPMTGEFSVNGLVEEIIRSGFAWSPDMRGQFREEAQFPYMETMARTVVSHLVYAVSRTSEVSEGKNDRPPVKQKKGGPKQPKPAKVHQVGYRTGAAIADTLRKAREGEPGASTGRRMPAHIRAAHPHLYRVGLGRQDVELKFLDPIPVNVDRDDGDTTTMHPMGY